ncbi:MAG: sensor histidine kinase, partial [Brumimicrobium sp.]
LFNGLTFFGFFTAVAQFIIFFPQDVLSALFHSVYGIYCIIALFLHHKGLYQFAKVSLCLIVIIFGTAASVRIGSEYYPHVVSFGIVGAIFVFFDVKKEWGYLVLFTLLHATSMIIIESDIWTNTAIQFNNPQLLRIGILISTALFLAIEILTILRLSWLTEKEINANLHKSNSELQQINEEKTVMLQEIHHRVKNNFQVIISLIKLQTKTIEDPKTIVVFDELRMRLISISRMHEMMYLSDKINKIDFKNYVNELSQMILETLNTKDNIKLTVDSNVEHVSAEGIVPLALLLNELITNSIKHAFDENKDKENTIKISFHRKEKGLYQLKYVDNGIWKTKKDKKNGFGLELIELLTEQLDGKFKRVANDHGTEYTFELNF